MPQSSLTAWLSRSNPAIEPGSAADDTNAQKDAATVNDLAPSRSAGELDTSQIEKKLNHLPKEPIGATQRQLTANVELRSCTKEDLTQLKQLTSLLLPIPYPEKFFREIIEDEVINNITLLAVWHDDPGAKGRDKGRLVGAIRCRLLAHPPTSKQRDGPPMLYLSTLVLLSPYRSHGIATHMLRMLARRAADDYGITTVGAHVWEANTDGLHWYEKRGFREIGREAGYYRRLDPQGAVILQREVGVMDLLGR